MLRLRTALVHKTPAYRNLGSAESRRSVSPLGSVAFLRHAPTSSFDRKCIRSKISRKWYKTDFTMFTVWQPHYFRRFIRKQWSKYYSNACLYLLVAKPSWTYLVWDNGVATSVRCRILDRPTFDTRDETRHVRNGNTTTTTATWSSRAVSGSMGNRMLHWEECAQGMTIFCFLSRKRPALLSECALLLH
jgi:hypothetical protein